MKKGMILLLAMLGVAFGAMAEQPSIAGAAAFKKAEPVPVKTTEVTPEISKVEKIKQEKAAAFEAKKKATQDAYLKKRVGKERALNNPRYVKEFYGREKGQQKAINAAQEEELNKKTYATAAEKEAARKEIESRALVKFKDFDGDAQTVNTKINQAPSAAVMQMMENTTYQDPSKMTREYSEQIAVEAEQIFVDNQGVTSAEYRKLYGEQLEADAAGEDDKAETFLDTETTSVAVQKVDESTALIRVGAPKSKATTGQNP